MIARCLSGRRIGCRIWGRERVDVGGVVGLWEGG